MGNLIARPRGRLQERRGRNELRYFDLSCTNSWSSGVCLLFLRELSMAVLCLLLPGVSKVKYMATEEASNDQFFLFDHTRI